MAKLFGINQKMAMVFILGVIVGTVFSTQIKAQASRLGIKI